jgi:hypothetical protein
MEGRDAKTLYPIVPDSIINPSFPAWRRVQNQRTTVK